MEFRNIVIQILNSERKGSVLHNQKNLQIKNINSLRIDTGRYPQMRFVKEPRYQIHANFKAEVIEIEKKLAEEIREAIWDCQREKNYSQKVYERNIQRRLLKNPKITVISHGTIEKIDQYGNPWEEWMDGKSMHNSQGILQPFFYNVPVQGTSYVKYVPLESKTTDKKEKDKKEKSWWEKVWDDVKEYASNTWDKITSEEFLDKTIKISGTIAGAVVLGAAIVCTAGVAGAAVGAAATYLGASAAIAGVATTATTYGGYALATAVGIDAANTSVEIGTGTNYIAKGAYNLFGDKDKGEEYFLNAYREGSDFLTMLGYSYATFGAYAMQSGYSIQKKLYDSSSTIKEIESKSPQQLIEEGWKDVTNPQMAENTTSRELYDYKSGLKVRFDKGVNNAKGFEAVDHYHVINPNYTNKKVDYYLDIDGKPVGKGSKSSHIVINKGEHK